MKNLIVIPFNLPWEWSTDYTNQTAFVLGKKNIVICYMWSECLSLKEYFIRRKIPKLIKKYSKNIYLFYPILFIPFKRFKTTSLLNEKINILLLKVLIQYLSIRNSVKSMILWVFDPQTEPLLNYFSKSWISLYDCVDYFVGSATNPEDKKKITTFENNLINRVDYVFANSTVLKKHIMKIKKDVVLVPQGFRRDSFDMYKYSDKIPVLKRNNKPLIGFIGAVNYRIDYKLIYELAIKHNEWDFAVWGPVLQIELFSKDQLQYFEKLKKLPNIILGQSDKKDIPGIVKQFDIGMIPYIPDDDFNKYCYPMKLFEFFYVGMPVVSIEIEELKQFPDLVKIGKTPKEWEDIIQYYLSNKLSTSILKKQRNFARQNSWSNKVQKILYHIK